MELNFKFSGYDHKLGEFVKRVIQKFMDYIISDECIWKYLKMMWRNLPVLMVLIHTLMQSFPISRKKLNIIPYLHYETNDPKILTPENMSKFRKSFLESKFDLKMLVCGNFVEKETKDIFKNLKTILKNHIDRTLV